MKIEKYQKIKNKKDITLVYGIKYFFNVYVVCKFP